MFSYFRMNKPFLAQDHIAVIFVKHKKFDLANRNHTYNCYRY